METAIFSGSRSPGVNLLKGKGMGNNGLEG
jgi:hypothetical protein